MGEKLEILRRAFREGLAVIVRDASSGKEHRGIVKGLDERIPLFPAVQIETAGQVTHHPDLRSAQVTIVFA